MLCCGHLLVHVGSQKGSLNISFGPEGAVDLVMETNVLLLVLGFSAVHRIAIPGVIANQTDRVTQPKNKKVWNEVLAEQ